jgi:glycosyltransferase involved in cell wall biosynthesis
MSGGPIIAVTSSAGDPLDERTWSSTPLRIVEALERRGVQVLPIDSSLPRSTRILCRLVNHMLGLDRDYGRGPLTRMIRAQVVQRKCQAAGIINILHTGSFDLPFLKQSSGAEHFLYCDSTWNLWTGCVSNIADYSQHAVRTYERFEKRGYQHVKHFFPIAAYVRDNLVRHYGASASKITVVGTGRGKIAAFRGKKDYRHGPILFVAKGRFEDKGGELLAKAFRIAVSKKPDLQLVMVGAESYLSRIGDIPNVRLTGHLPWPELQKLFETASLFAMPAVNEPWGLVYLEALACKTPVLGLNRNALPEITKRGRFGFLVDEPTPECVAAAILDAFSDAKRLQKMGTEGQAFCLAEFSWDAVAGRLQEIVLGPKR